MFKGYKWLIILTIVATSPSAFAFTLISNNGKPAFWPNSTIHYRFYTGTSGYFTGGHDASGTATDEFQPIRAAFNTWATTPGLSISFIEDATTDSMPVSNDGHNTIAWVKTNWSKLSFSPPAYALAVTLMSFDNSTGAVTDADIYFNAQNFQWAVVDSGTENGYIDVQNIATHEEGHLLGLDHSSEDPAETDLTLSEATMYYASSMGETSRRTLKQDDLNAIQSLYGVSSESVPEIDSVDTISSSTTSMKYHIHGKNFGDQTSFTLTKNSGSISDVVSRFRTIISSTDAEATFDSSGFPGGESTLIAMNNVSSMSSFSLNVEGFKADSASGGGGGGCSILLSSGNASPSFLAWAFLSAFLLVLSCLRQFARPLAVSKVQSRHSSTK